jgi:hypothetical protein
LPRQARPAQYSSLFKSLGIIVRQKKRRLRGVPIYCCYDKINTSDTLP